ncbi:hypothetical protein [Actinacidiphila glaucinigra]|uniref:hypothetical protein n=1 Tax=Actinacidiphila glaucinigra TaxID=235986 RepID=UPI0036EDC684
MLVRSAALDAQADVIPACYGLALALALPLRRLGAARDLALVAPAGAPVLPRVPYPVRAAAHGGGWADVPAAAGHGGSWLALHLVPAGRARAR